MSETETLRFRKSSYSGSGNDCVEVAEALFHKSSYSANSANCVEVAEGVTGAAVRDSKHPDLGYLGFAASEWTALLGALDSK
ncbi:MULTISPECIES: DUF397 domain-containing protein [unclassified Nocardiopsis]|uniref:DUF397 domain-containing protein n=1 Tax=Nocardiopsis TaxID=2013 RepID=UPI00387ADA34